jgi:hypothetical protein
VFVVVTSSLDYDDSDDTGEGQALPWRTYNLRLVCEAFVRSAAEVVTTALGSGTQTVIPTPTSVTIDSGSSTTGWTGNYYRYDSMTADKPWSHPGRRRCQYQGPAVKAAAHPNASTGPALGRHVADRIHATGRVDVSVTKQIVVSWKWEFRAPSGPPDNRPSLVSACSSTRDDARSISTWSAVRPAPRVPP